jgi:hypothetical protein
MTFGPEEATPPTQGQALQRSLLNAVTFNFLDELEGLVRAGGLDPNDEDALKSMAALVRGGWRKLGGDPEAEKLYQEQVRASRAKTQELSEAFPKTSIAGEVAGAAALPIGVAARGASMLGRAGYAALTGAGVGGLSGFGAGEGLGGSAMGAAIGAPVGAAIGGVAAPAIETGANVVRALARPITGFLQPEEEALRRIGSAAVREQTRTARLPASQQPLAADEFADLQAAGVPVAAIDRLGEQGRALARSAANTDPLAREALEGLAAERVTTSGARLSNFLRGQFNYPSVDAQQQAIREASLRVNPVAYRAAETEATRLFPAGLWDEGLEQIASAPIIQDAIRKAVVTGRNRAAREGFPPIGNPFVIDRTTGAMTLREGARPTLGFWDEVKKNLDKVNSREAQDWSRVLRERLDEMVPSYGQARSGAAAFFGERDALSAGAAFVGSGRKFGSIPEVRRTLHGMNETERNLFRDGYVDRLAHQMSTLSGAERTNLLNRIERTPAAREEIEIALGVDGARQFLSRLRVENIMDRLRPALGGSQTARYLTEIGLAGGIGGFFSDFDPTTIGAVGLLPIAKRAVDRRVARRVGEMLASNDQAVIDRAIEMIGRNATLRPWIAALDDATARIGGQLGNEMGQ